MRHFRLFFAVLAFLLPASLRSADPPSDKTVRGSINDNSGQGIGGVTITIVPSNRADKQASATSKKDGSCSAKAALTGKFTLMFSGTEFYPGAYGNLSASDQTIARTMYRTKESLDVAAAFDLMNTSETGLLIVLNAEKDKRRSVFDDLGKKNYWLIFDPLHYKAAYEGIKFPTEDERETFSSRYAGLKAIYDKVSKSLA